MIRDYKTRQKDAERIGPYIVLALVLLGIMLAGSGCTNIPTHTPFDDCEYNRETCYE